MRYSKFKTVIKSILAAGCILSSLSLYAQHTKLFDFNGINGSEPWGSLISDGTFLYGMTGEGGVNNNGVIFKILPNGSGYVKLFDFEAATSGNFTPGSLIYDGTFLYGMANDGGANDSGTIFKIRPDGTGFLKLLDFAGSTNGARPEGSLFSDGTFLYGMTSAGGTNNLGTIFKILPDGTGYVKLLDFNGTANGSFPFGSLISDGTFLYGMTSAGGSSNEGTIFKIQKDGSGYVRMLNFTGASNGSEPFGSLLYDGTFLYGMTLAGGTINDGTIFKIRTDGTGYVRMFNFNLAIGDQPFGDLVFDGTFLYGMTYSGGSGGTGNLFKIKPDGTGFAGLHDFATVADGWLPYGSPLLIGPTLYGMTQQGGTAGGDGTIFSYQLPISPPTITSFTPASGDVGTTVTITGSFFNLTPANNIVYFGATRAVVLTATATQLSVTVPIGATYSPITVLNATTDLLGYSMSNFTPTFTPNKCNITTADFEPKVDFTTGSNPISVSIGDLDGDGKADLAVGNTASNTISVLRNTGTGPGNIGYAAKVDFPAANDPETVAIGDLDGDGKPDLAVANYIGFSVSVFRNTSTGVGNINYATKVDFALGSPSRYVAIGDLDGDGKADLAVAGETSHVVSVFRNTSTGPGNISYAARVDFPTGAGSGPRWLSIDDFDGDGKADLAVANFNISTVSVFRNTSTAGTVSFAARVDLAAGTNPLSICAGDFDSDGKTDLAALNLNSNTLSIFRNTSSGVGNISYAAKVDVVTNSATRSVSTGDLDGDGKVDLAVTNHSVGSISVFRNTSTGAGNIGYATKVEYGTSTSPPYASLGDLDGDGISDLVVANAGSNSVSVIRNNPVFFTLTNFTPTSGPIGTSVIINGTNFDTTPANNIVQFNGTTAVVSASTTTNLTTTVPSGATTGKISVTVDCHTEVSANDFTVSSTGNQPPIIESTTTAVPIEGIISLDLDPLISDPDNNLDPNSLYLVNGVSEQGASASLDNAFILTLDYGGVQFFGTDRISLGVCDLVGECVEQELTIEVGGDIVVYNAVSPDGNGLNDTFFLQYIDILPNAARNHVSIFNRWGDLVFEATDYNNQDRVFTGLNQNGKELPSGIYYYKIEFSSGSKAKTGYLSLKR